MKYVMLDDRGINPEDCSLDGDGKLEYVTMCVSPVFYGVFDRFNGCVRVVRHI